MHLAPDVQRRPNRIRVKGPTVLNETEIEGTSDNNRANRLDRPQEPAQRVVSDRGEIARGLPIPFILFFRHCLRPCQLAQCISSSALCTYSPEYTRCRPPQGAAYKTKPESNYGLGAAGGGGAGLFGDPAAFAASASSAALRCLAAREREPS